MQEQRVDFYGLMTILIHSIAKILFAFHHAHALVTYHNAHCQPRTHATGRQSIISARHWRAYTFADRFSKLPISRQAIIDIEYYIAFSHT